MYGSLRLFQFLPFADISLNRSFSFIKQLNRYNLKQFFDGKFIKAKRFDI